MLFVRHAWINPACPGDYLLRHSMAAAALPRHCKAHEAGHETIYSRSLRAFLNHRKQAAFKIESIFRGCNPGVAPLSSSRLARDGSVHCATRRSSEYLIRPDAIERKHRLRRRPRGSQQREELRSRRRRISSGCHRQRDCGVIRICIEHLLTFTAGVDSIVGETNAIRLFGQTY